MQVDPFMTRGVSMTLGLDLMGAADGTTDRGFFGREEERVASPPFFFLYLDSLPCLSFIT